MIRPMLNRVLSQVLAWAAVIALGAGVALAQDAASAAPAAPAAGQRTDGQIEMDVVHALDASKALKKDMITAATIQSEVTLSGTVSSDASRELAESIAAHVAGVTVVHNNLRVGNAQDAQDAQPAVAPEPDPAQAADNNQPDYGPVPPPQGLPQQPAGSDQGQNQAPYSPPPPPPPVRPQYPQGQQYPQYPQGQQYPQYPQGQQYPQGRPQYGQMSPPPAYEAPKGPVTVPSGTLLQVRTNEALGTKHAKDGTPVQFTVIHDVAFGGVLAIPRGATVRGVVTESKKAGELAGSPELALTLTSLDLGGQSYNLATDQFKVKGPNKAGQTVGSAVGGGLIGTIIGCAVGRGVGCAVGAGAGVAAGTAASAASSGPGIWIPAEALVDFHLKDPLTVNPVSSQEAARLAQGLYPGGPTLYRRSPYPYYGQPYAAAYPYYAYPPVYYRPYFISGGYYYWR